ncbi:MAG: glycosyltransferase [Desulfomonilia bacterium]|nr:lipopolysaccharide kinase InaA family protein [Pseudomonadota bacterium]HPD20148.1 lipopolysaccharide kinase InaA family protein [Deltaproteobacteria bacterium]HPX17934.1 lipopolysaccharide kinase InaA family protein [Deltaproteobacteria bacterium]HRS54880.1 lipopolysaccharide kinase InaA family protein [Desulfomonilia bacterium]HRV34365.1 lipopolysaccharide kinase InaA family protein [Desulfomonilia bacterium]
MNDPRTAQEERPRLSIVIVSLGLDDLLGACIASIGEHVRVPHEIIVVNNSPQELGYRGNIRIRCLENGKNLGFARAVNRGIRESRGDTILLLNPDARFTSDIVTPMLSFLDERRQAGIAGPQLVFPDGSLQNSVDILPNLFTELLNKSLLKILFPGAYPSKRSGFTHPVQVPSVIGACMMIKRQVIDTIGPLDEGFFLYLEETDFCKRAADAGFEIWHLPQLTVTHHQGTSARRFDAARKVEYRRSMYRFFLKHRGIAQTALLVLFIMIKLGVELLGGIAASFLSPARTRLKKSLSLMLWHLAGAPAGWGFERTLPFYRIVHRHGYTWFLPENGEIPPDAEDPGRFMETALDTVLNRSKTTFVKSGTLQGRQIFLKRYNFKGYLDAVKNLFRKSRARKAFEGALMLELCGIPTPPVVFACERRIMGVLTESYIATERVEALDLVRHVELNGYDTGLIMRVAGFVRRLHEMGFVPLDLKGENLLVGTDAIYLIDLDRLKRRRFPGMRIIAKNLSYLNASFAREIPLADRLLFLDEYAKGNPLLKGKKDELARRIGRLTARRIKTRYTE